MSFFLSVSELWRLLTRQRKTKTRENTSLVTKKWRFLVIALLTTFIRSKRLSSLWQNVRKTSITSMLNAFRLLLFTYEEYLNWTLVQQSISNILVQFDDFCRKRKIETSIQKSLRSWRLNTYKMRFVQIDRLFVILRRRKRFWSQIDYISLSLWLCMITLLTNSVQKDRNDREMPAEALKYEHDVSIFIIRRILKKNDFHCVKSTRKSDLTDKMKQNRYEFAKKYENWIIENWKNVIWIDEISVVMCKSSISCEELYWCNDRSSRRSTNLT